jgi:hypothetical protein
VTSLLVQLTLGPGTAPLLVGVPKVQLTVSTTLPRGCSTVIVASRTPRL